MSGIALKDLTKYHQRAMQYFKNGLVSEQNRLFAQTEEAGAVSFWPLGGTPLEGKVKFSFKETPPANGEKGPENPSTIAGVDSIVLGKCGKNKFLWTLSAPSTRWGVTFSYDADGTITMNGTCNRSTGVVNSSQFIIDLNPPLRPGNSNTNIKATIKHVGGTYTLPSGVDLATQIQMVIRNVNGIYNYAWVNDIGTDTEKTFGVNANSEVTHATVKACGGVAYNNYKIKIQYEVISNYNDLEYEAPIFDSYSLPLGSTYYGGEIDLATGVMTVTHDIRYITPNISFSSSVFREDTDRYGLYFYLTNAIKKTGVVANYTCNYFDVVYNSYSPAKSALMVATNNNGIYLFLDKEEFSLSDGLTQAGVIDAVRPWFEGKNVIFCYPLATPFTVQLTPLQLTTLTQKDKYTPRMNTVYTDADSIQIRYRKSLIHDEDEKVQAIVALGGNV